MTNPKAFGFKAPACAGSDLRFRAAGRTPQLAGGIPIVKPPRGRITAIGLNTGEHAWMVPKTLLFSGEGLGGGPVFRAHDKVTGKTIAALELPAPTTGLPITYLYGGRQYIVVAVGSSTYPAGLVVLALPGRE